MTFLLVGPATSWAQGETNTPTLSGNGDFSSFTFSESQLDDDADISQSAAVLTSFNEDAYLSNVGYLFSPMRFKVRAFDNQYNGVYFNGARLNDVETGRFSYGLIGGLNDATRNQQGITAYEQNTIGYMDLGGGSNINMRASQYAAGTKAVLSLTNRNYKVRGMLTHATGLHNGWAFAISGGIRWSDEGNIEGTFYHSLSLYTAIQKILNDRHSLSLSAMLAPTERAQQSASTEEAYWLANSHYYNANWGYQNGKKRNARVVNTFEPTAVLTWDYDIKEGRKLTTTAVYKYSTYGTTAFNWGNNAADPRPDYYKNLPSSAFNVHEDIPEAFQMQQWQNLYDFWTFSKANRQINWDRMYAINREAAARGEETVYFLEERHNDQSTFILSSTYNHSIDKNHRIDAGIQYNFTKGMHYKTMNDLLGGTEYTDIDKFSVNDYGRYSIEAQNDLDHPNRKIAKGDRFGYDYDILVNKGQAWAQYTYTRGHFSAVASGDLTGTTIERHGNMRNGRSPEHSKGSSGVASFLGGGGKLSLGYSLNAHHKFYVSGGYEERPPIAYNSFIAARIKNDFVNGLTLENILHGEAAYKFNFGPVSGKLTGFYARFGDQVEQSAFYDDQATRFTYLTMNGVKKEHYGGELAIVYNVTGNLSFNFIGTISEAKYTSNPYATLTYENATEVVITDENHEGKPLRVIADGMRVSGTPLTALSIGADYSIKGWFFGINLNYYDRVYLDFSEYRRLTKSLTAYTPTVNATTGALTYSVTQKELDEKGGLLYDNAGHLVKAYAPEQEKFDGGFMLDASIGRYIRLKGGRSISLNLSLQNILNNTELRTGGYEQNRDDSYSTGVARAYVFSKNAKYYYANPFNAFFNIGYRF